ncbi:DUF3617 domain-containing protein [Sphingomicrobium astaxanthinifaciens]|uniref:DUF3617 domain-containing protein n=1 Tax=Sphingomicrobium astaxanthinifaciens TaxID=1227949 RepID=UPI001FCB45C2|nr:DUF3617 family protein [Sphingomicrobium astaxanthinifaciens]MCJ7421475.1 DUF3617 domain-containing protein [Sphingomicrobium astaxanthinifaciens]
MKTRILATSALALALAACGSGDSAAEEEAVAPVDTLLPGNFEITSEVTSLDSTDEADPVTSAELGSTTTANVCVGEDGLLPAAAFGEEGDDCVIENPYVRRGKIRQALVCQREGQSGQIRLQVDAEFTEDGVDGTVQTVTYFSGEGDYAMTRTLSGRRTGDCTEAEAEADLEAEVAQ